MTERDLTLVGLTEDKAGLVLVGATGEEFILPNDAKLRAAVRGEAARLGQLEIQMESVLRPRDIQARIRAGDSPEKVATAAQTSLDKIMGYATPVLAERAHVAERAQRASVRRPAGEGPTRLLGDAVADRLRARNVDPRSVAWDAWRREDSRWTLVADYLSGESSHHAEFVYDALGRYVVADDDEARWLVGEKTTRTGALTEHRQATGPRRLSSVGGRRDDDDELPLGEDAIELVTDPAPAGDADWIATQATERLARPATEPSGDDRAADGVSTARRPVKDKRGRASVPSWDDIMFGGGKRD